MEKITNKEWLFKEENLNSLLNMLRCPYNKELGAYCFESDSCNTCKETWLNASQPTPMPELKDGMFIRAKTANYSYIGIIVDNVSKVAYDNGNFDMLDNVEIVGIYDAFCFMQCNGNRYIWEKK